MGWKKWLLALVLLPLSAYAAPRIATSDWTIAETLTAMGHPPVGVGDKRAYQIWVGHPSLPERSADAGLRFQPNLERLRQLRPELFIQSSWFTHLKPQFERIAPVRELNFVPSKGMDYAHTVQATRQLGQLVGDSAAAEQLIQSTAQALQQHRQTLVPYAQRPLAIIQFIDPRHVRIYGNTSLFQVVLQQLGLRNAWTGASNEWGFSTIAVSELAKLPANSLLVIVQPHPRQVRPALEKSAVWQRLPYAQSANRRVLPPSWSYGALPSMEHFARMLATYVPRQQELAW